MANLFIHVKVKDFHEWKNGFDGGADIRASFGLTSDRIFQDADDSNSVFILLKCESIDNARKFSQSAQLKTSMEKAGVEMPPHFHFMNEV
ncbi:MAG: hypothetical protein AB9891_07170 [Anaerolineaceae bacterium]